MAWTPEECTAYANTALERIAAGEGMAEIGRDDSMPSATRLYEMIDGLEDGKEKYGRARERQAEVLAGEIVAISDDLSDDPASRRIRVDARKWVAAHLKPKQWGDKPAPGSDSDNPMHTVIEWRSVKA